MTAAKRKPDTPEPTEWNQPGSLFESMERVPRPSLKRHKFSVEREVQAILDTINAGDSVRLVLKNAEDFRKAHMTLRHATRIHGAGFHYQRFGDRELRVWAEKVSGTKK